MEQLGYTLGGEVFSLATRTFSDGDRVVYGMQGEVLGPVTGPNGEKALLVKRLLPCPSVRRSSGWRSAG